MLWISVEIKCDGTYHSLSPNVVNFDTTASIAQNVTYVALAQGLRPQVSVQQLMQLL